MNSDDHMEGRIRKWIGKSRLEAPEGMSERIMNAVHVASKPEPRALSGKVQVYFIISLLLMPLALFLTDKAYMLFVHSLGELGKYFIYYKYVFIAVFTAFALFQIDFYLKNKMEKLPRLTYKDTRIVQD